MKLSHVHRDFAMDKGAEMPPAYKDEQCTTGVKQ